MTNEILQKANDLSKQIWVGERYLENINKAEKEEYFISGETSNIQIRYKGFVFSLSQAVADKLFSEEKEKTIIDLENIKKQLSEL